MTAKEILSKQGVITSPVSGLESYLLSNAINAMVEFAKIKVQEALQAASEKALLKGYHYNRTSKKHEFLKGESCYWKGHPEDQPYPDLNIDIDEESILSSYDINLIK